MGRLIFLSEVIRSRNFTGPSRYLAILPPPIKTHIQNANTSLFGSMSCHSRSEGASHVTFPLATRTRTGET